MLGVATQSKLAAQQAQLAEQAAALNRMRRELAEGVSVQIGCGCTAS